MGKHAFPPLPIRPRLVLAVYPALFSRFHLISIFALRTDLRTQPLIESLSQRLKSNVHVSFSSAYLTLELNAVIIRALKKIKPEESLNARVFNDVKFDGNTLKNIAIRSLSLDRPP